MKITLKNFGIVKEFKFDLDNDLNIIFGGNNTGKSYMMSAIYLIIKNIMDLNAANIYASFHRYHENLLDFYKNNKENFDKKINIKSEIEEGFSIVLEEILLTEIQSSLLNTFSSISSLENKLSGASLSIEIETYFFSIFIGIKKEALYISNIQLKAEKVFLDKSTAYKNITLRFEDGSNSAHVRNSHDIYEKLKSFILSYIRLITIELKNKIKNIYYLPASRSGLYQALNAFSPIIAELSKNRRFITNKIELPSLSEPLSDYFLELSTIQIRDNVIDNKITKIASEMEKTILNGKIAFDGHTKKLVFSPNRTNLKLDLSYTSSMVSELSPIVSYLRYVVNYSNHSEDTAKEAKPLIIIEEPEAHLHPDIQIKLLTLFAELAKSDVKFIITTHSNYMFNKFNNLVISKDINTNKSSASLFKETPLGSEVTDMALDEFGMEDENFIYTSESLYNEKMQLIKEMNI